MKLSWESFKEARTIGLIGLAVLAAVTYFSGRYDEIRLLEYWALMLVCGAASIYIMRHVGEVKAKWTLVLLFLAAGLIVWLIIQRQNLRHEALLRRMTSLTLILRQLRAPTQLR